MTINELIKKAHSNAKAKGWWDEERNTGELLMLIVSECGEALEAHRNGKMGDLAAFDSRQEDRDDGVGGFESDFKELIKDSFPDELSDIVIRIADLLGHLNAVDIAGPSDESRLDGNVGAALLEVVGMVAVSCVVAMDGVDDMRIPLSAAAMKVFAIAKAHNIDLWRHIELKMAYNETRPRRHSKLY